MDADLRQYCVRFGRHVRDLRLRLGLTQEDMMDRGFRLRHCRRIEAGRSVTLATLWKLAHRVRYRAARHAAGAGPRAPRPVASRNYRCMAECDRWRWG